MKALLVRTLLGLVVLALVAPAARAQARKSDGVVKVTAKADKPDAEGNQTVTLTFAIDKGWHLYANPVGNDTLVPNQTTIKAVTKVADLKVNYPPGKVVKDSVVGDYKTYEGQTVIKAQIKRTKGDTSPLELSVKVQACNDTTCLLPATVKLTVE